MREIHGAFHRFEQFCSPGTSLLVDQVLLHPFEELPDPARHYIWARAGVVFQQRHVGSLEYYRFTEQFAQSAWVLLLHDEQGVERFNIFSSGLNRDLERR